MGCLTCGHHRHEHGPCEDGMECLLCDCVRWRADLSLKSLAVICLVCGCDNGKHYDTEPHYPEENGCSDCTHCTGFMPKEGGNMPDEVGKGSPLKKWVCSCEIHTVNLQTGQTRKGPYIIRCTGDGLVAICQWCEQPFKRVDEGTPRKRRSKICGAHCPEGAHNHD